ncbi:MULTISPECIES: NAD-dependent epimerase/dehydratase family protein [Butyricimonas]|uniref:NAD-dependent epimerase/dehydratase family protein n=1 Tax=Butyricimonas TaxID=574697 RepID=UPI0007FB5239|nr:MULTISPECIES: NAD-dependent epimerase/dehydratase family protein [Butyricimonas]
MSKRILITGAAGNLGGLLACRLKDDDVFLHLLTHRKEVLPELRGKDNISVYKADLGVPGTLVDALRGVDTVVHFAGVLFRHNPEKFLATTNTRYFNNLLDVAVEQGVKRVILVSFPHVEGETTPEHPATGRLDGNPVSVHAITRLEEEKLLFECGRQKRIEAVSLRVGMVYGRGILMIDAARWFSRYALLGVWRKPTWIHLISTEDFLEATRAACLKEGIEGVYHVGDDGVQTLQEFLDVAAIHWHTVRPWRMPLWMINTAARFFELFSRLLGVRSPLTVDFVRIGQVSYYGDTSRMKKELLPRLKYRDFRKGIETL